MWYTKTIIVKQNPFFYDQIDTDNCKIAYEKGDLTENKIDKTEYIYEGQFGAIFKSIEKKHPFAGDDRIIFGVQFQCTSVYKLGWRKYECWWTSNKLKTHSTIKEFEKEYVF